MLQSDKQDIGGDCRDIGGDYRTFSIRLGGMKEAGRKQQVGAVSLKIEREGDKSNLWLGWKKKQFFCIFNQMDFISVHCII